MKKLIKKRLHILLFILLITNFITAQPQWNFHIAFEDVTGAKDTIWLIWDTDATFGVDTQFNEQAQKLNYSVFNVFIRNTNADTTKTQALPHPYASNNVDVHAINYQYPITISWDSSLFHAPGLPLPVGYVNRAFINNDYFFLVNNDPYSHTFNMLMENHVSAPWWGYDQFPMGFYIMRDPSIGINENDMLKKYLILFPNPCNDFINISSDLVIKSYHLLSSDGKVIQSNLFTPSKNENSLTISLSKIENGVYQLILTDSKNQSYHEKVIVIH